MELFVVSAFLETAAPCPPAVSRLKRDVGHLAGTRVYPFGICIECLVRLELRRLSQTRIDPLPRLGGIMCTEHFAAPDARPTPLLAGQRTPLEEPTAPYHICLIHDNQVPEICSWIRSASELTMVSDQRDGSLTPPTLREWIARSEAGLVLCRPDGPIAFCTLSKSELPYVPCHCIEVCHLIVAPPCRRLFDASRLLDGARRFAWRIGMAWLYGRVAPGNLPAIALARFKKMSEVTDQEPWLLPGYLWFKISALCDAPKTLQGESE